MIEYEFEVYKNEIVRETKPILISGDENSCKLVFRLPKSLIKGDANSYVFSIISKRAGSEIERFLCDTKEIDGRIYVEWVLNPSVTNGSGDVYLQLEIIGKKFSWRSTITSIKVDVKIEDKILKEEELVLKEFYTKKQVDKLLESLSYSTSVEVRQLEENLLTNILTKKEILEIVEKKLSSSGFPTDDDINKKIKAALESLNFSEFLKKGDIFELYSNQGQPKAELKSTDNIDTFKKTGLYKYKSPITNLPDKSKEGLVYVIDGGELKFQFVSTNSGKIFSRVYLSGFWLGWQSIV